MTETKHSPGKWTTLNQDGDIYIEAESRCAVVARIFAGVGNAEDEANAKLIAAAPDLLEALRAMLKEFEQPDWEIWCDHSVGICNCSAIRILENAKETIKKATQ